MTRPSHGGNLSWAAKIAGCPESALLDFSASINPLGPPASAIAAIQSHLDTLKHYPDPNYSQLKQALADWHGLDPQWILPGNGAAELLTWASWDLQKYPRTYLFTPAFRDYYRACETFGVPISPCLLSLDAQAPEVGEHLPPSKIEKMGILVNNPHNPTGKLFRRPSLLALLEHCGLLVADEAFMDFLLPAYQESLVDVVADYPNLVILRSLTKFYSLPGLRLGYAIAHPDRIATWQKWRDPWPVNSLAAAAATAMLVDREFQQLTWAWLEPAKQELYEGLADISGFSPLPGAANFLLVKTSIPGSKLQAQLLKQARILIRDCLSFPELGEHYFRLAVRLPAENRKLLDALTCLA